LKHLRLNEIVDTEKNKIVQAKESLKPVPRRLRFHRFSTVELLVALGLLFLFFPFVEEVKGGDVIISILLSLVLLSAVLAVADRKGVFYIALVLALPAIAGRWINHFRPDLLPPPLFLIAGLALVAFVVANLLRFVLQAPSVNTEVLCQMPSRSIRLAGQNRRWKGSTLSTLASSR
jgi:hypothetical protein